MIGCLVLLFVIKLKFPLHRNWTDIIRNKYGEEGIKLVRRTEKLSCKVEKCKLDIKFLETAKAYKVIPNFIKFKLFTKRLYNSNLVKGFHLKLLNSEILFKSRNLKNLSAQLTHNLSEINNSFSFLVFLY